MVVEAHCIPEKVCARFFRAAINTTTTRSQDNPGLCPKSLVRESLGLFLTLVTTMYSTSQSLSYALTFVAVLICSIYIRRIYFHSFSHVPGPFLAKITNAYSAYHAAKRNTHVVIQRLHEKYGM